VVLPFHALQIWLRPKADESVLVAQEVMRPKEAFELLAACPAVALPGGAVATRAVARAEARVAWDKLDAAQPAVADGMRAAGQVLPEICERVVRPTLPARAELASSFGLEVLTIASSHLYLSCGLFSLATGTNLRRREAKGKADFRDGLLACVDLLLNRYIVEALQGFNGSRSVRPRLVSAGD